MYLLTKVYQEKAVQINAEIELEKIKEKQAIEKERLALKSLIREASALFEPGSTFEFPDDEEEKGSNPLLLGKRKKPES
jgi:ApbE superfamily uncharacterized protein (UPF0280 family)